VTRAWRVALVGLLVLVGAQGCSSNSGVPLSGSHIRGAVQRAVLDAADSRGIPVQNDHVGCHGPDPSGTLQCEATTAYEPVGDLTASFSLLHTGRCAGTLTVVVDGSTLTSVQEDPCR
jgi:hypothetical protein